MARHTLFCDSTSLSDAATLVIGGDEAEHAVRSKRLRAGDVVSVTDGRGTVVTGRIDAARKSSVELTVVERSTAPRMRPAVRVYSATPKGPRLDKMIDQLSQAGAASWSPLDTALGVVDPGDKKMDRAHRIAVESAKQCARAWVMEIGESVGFDAVLGSVRAGGAVIVADASGPPYAAVDAEEIVVVVGPEGGFTEPELARAREAGAVVASFGPLVMRIETAAVAAAAIVMHAAGVRPPQ